MHVGCRKWLTLEAPCGLTTFPESTVDDGPDSEIEVDVELLNQLRSGSA